MSEDIKLKTWDGSERFLKQYSKLLSIVYNKDINFSHIKWKHSDSPIKPSLITYAEDNDGNLAAARAFWPMYSDGAQLYQPCDTVTHPDFQRRGLFSKLTTLCIESLPEDAAVMNFPNHNSFPGYMKLGWQLLHDNLKVFSYRLPFGYQEVFSIEESLKDKISEDLILYLAWRFHGKSGKNYRFWLSSQNLVISNGDQSGVISLHRNQAPFGAQPGKSIGYVIPTKYSKIKGLLCGSIALKCSARTAIYLKEKADIKTIHDCIQRAQINILMDTF